MKKLIIAIALVIIVVLGGVAGYLGTHHIHKTKTAERKVTAKPTPKPPSYAEQMLQKMPLRDKIASLFILHTPGADAAAIKTYLTAVKPGGLILMGDNIPDTVAELTVQTKTLITDPKLPPFISVDEEGDTVTRLEADTFPGPLTLRNQPPAATRTAFMQRSDLLKSTGINLNFGIIADVTADPNSFIYERVLGTTPPAASERVAQAVAGSKGRTLSTIKHFPGHGETAGDSHMSIPTTATAYADWQQRVAAPFRAGVNAGADMVMFGHLRYAAVDQQPATLSKKWHDIIRSELGYKGVVITDDMIMLQNSGEGAYADPVKNAITAIQAGNDVLLYVLNHEGGGSNVDPNALINGVVAAVNDGRISPSAIDAHALKVLTMRHELSKN